MKVLEVDVYDEMSATEQRRYLFHSAGIIDASFEKFERYIIKPNIRGPRIEKELAELRSEWGQLKILAGRVKHLDMYHVGGGHHDTILPIEGHHDTVLYSEGHHVGGGHQHNVQGGKCAALDMYHVGGGHHDTNLPNVHGQGHNVQGWKGAALEMYQQGEKDREYQTCILSTDLDCISRERRIENIRHVFSLQYEIVSAGREGQIILNMYSLYNTKLYQQGNKDRRVSLDKYFSLQFAGKHVS